MGWLGVTKDLKKARKPINARSETVATSGMFRTAFAKRRCLVPAPAYYEWRDDPDGGKTPFAVARVDGDPVAFAGIWEEWQSPEGETLRTFATMTTEANRQLAAIQDRMPVIIEREDWQLWLGETEGDPRALLQPVAENVGGQRSRQGQERRASAARAAGDKRRACLAVVELIGASA
jgi:putative SOS response-associated peptidase YedK